MCALNNASELYEACSCRPPKKRPPRPLEAFSDAETSSNSRYTSPYHPGSVSSTQETKPLHCRHLVDFDALELAVLGLYFTLDILGEVQVPVSLGLPVEADGISRWTIRKKDGVAHSSGLNMLLTTRYLVGFVKAAFAVLFACQLL